MPSADLVRSLRTQIVDQLRGDVLSGRIERGSVLRQQELAARFRVSPTPIREALLQLTQEGLLEATPNSSVKVRPMPPDFIQRFLTPLRQMVEEYALELCFSDLNEEDFQRFDTILEQLRAACERGDHLAIAEQDLAFHQSIVRRAGQPDLEAVWGALMSRVRTFFQQGQHTFPVLMEIYYDHAMLIDTFRKGDLQASKKALDEHILSALNTLEEDAE